MAYESRENSLSRILWDLHSIYFHILNKRRVITNNPVYIQGSYAVKRVKIIVFEKRPLKVTESSVESHGEVKGFC